jgi:enoyl-CoA hydratase/carnithine racemase
MTLGIEIEVADNVGILAINRPAVRNAIDLPTANEIADALDDFEARSDVRAIVLTGRNGIFSAGMDLKALTATNQRPITASRGAFGVVENPPAKPMLAAVEGAALGGGLEIAMSADVIIVAENARLGLPEVGRGLVATAGGVLRLPKRIPRAVALEMIMTGLPIAAGRAFQIGLVNQVVPDGAALDRAVEVAQIIAANAPMAVRAAKAVALGSVQWRDDEGFALQRRSPDPVRVSSDAAEGARAFVEKRRPVWQDA